MVKTNELVSARGKKGYTQEDVANLLGCSAASYNRKELGVSDFKLSEVISLCEILSIPVKERALIFLS